MSLNLEENTFDLKKGQNKEEGMKIQFLAGKMSVSILAWRMNFHTLSMMPSYDAKRNWLLLTHYSTCNKVLMLHQVIDGSCFIMRQSGIRSHEKGWQDNLDLEGLRDWKRTKTQGRFQAFISSVSHLTYTLPSSIKTLAWDHMNRDIPDLSLSLGFTQVQLVSLMSHCNTQAQILLASLPP